MYLTQNSTGTVGEFNNPQVAYTASTQTEIDAYLLTQAKAAKVTELEIALQTWRDAGLLYTGWIFNLSERSALYAKSKNDSEDTTGANRYKYSDIAYTQRDFTDNPGFNGFSQSINDEEDRIMVLYNNYRLQIEDASTVAAVDAITISFAP